MDLLSAARAAAEELVVGACLEGVNCAGVSARVPPRVVAQSVPGLAHSHEPTRLPAVPGCLFCARSGNALAEQHVLGTPQRRDVVARLQMPILEGILGTYDALLDLLRDRKGIDVEDVRRELVDPLRAFLALCRRALEAE